MMDPSRPEAAQQEHGAGADRRGERPTAAAAGERYVDELRQLVELVERGDLQALDHLLPVLHAHDLAKLFGILPRARWPEVIARLDIGQISDLLEELPDHLRDDLAEHLVHEQLRTAIGEMASDDAADVLADLPAALARDLIEALPRQGRREVEALLKYPEDTAGGLMQLELLAVPDTHTVADAIEMVRAKPEEVSTFHFVYVVDDRQRLVGVLNLGALLLAPPEQPIAELMKRDVHTVGPEVDQEHVARLFRRYDLVALPVVDSRGRLLGRILHDDVVDVLQEEADEDILRMAGATVFEPELVYTDQVLKIASVRLPWLLATLVGLTVPALLVAAFQVSFPEMMTLVPFIPVIGAMGGNVGGQSSTIIVRGFATGRVDFGNLGRFLLKEAVVGLLMGLSCGLVVAVVATLWRGDPRLSVTVAVSMLVAMVTAAMLGVLVPYFFRLIRIDPAIAAGPLVTTINDTTAIGIYYLAALVLVGR
jgi:magnesium transporter